MIPRFVPAGDTAVVVEFGDVIDRALSAEVLRFSDRIRAANIEGLIETVPTIRSVLVHYDPLITSGSVVTEKLGALIGMGDVSVRRRKRWRIPVCYARSCGPDLAEVAERTGLSPDEVVAQHAQTQFHVYMIGFVPGYAYMGDLPKELQLPRRTDPRVRVPPGSVAIAAEMTTIYPIESPGGWHLIGATSIRLFDPAWDRPSLLGPGDAVCFEPIDLTEYQAIQAAVANNTYMLASEELTA
jgi:inhibitor of KinA